MPWVTMKCIIHIRIHTWVYCPGIYKSRKLSQTPDWRPSNWWFPRMGVMMKHVYCSTYTVWRSYDSYEITFLPTPISLVSQRFHTVFLGHLGLPIITMKQSNKEYLPSARQTWYLNIQHVEISRSVTVKTSISTGFPSVFHYKRGMKPPSCFHWSLRCCRLAMGKRPLGTLPLPAKSHIAHSLWHLWPCRWQRRCSWENKFEEIWRMIFLG